MTSGEPPEDLEFGATIRGAVVGQKLFGRYILERQIGRGGMGVVWLARDTELDRAVALKLLPELLVHDRLAMEDLKRETLRSLQLTHPHIVRIYDFLRSDPWVAISMEYVAGENLANKRFEKPNRVFEAGEMVAWVAQLCEALEYAHAKAKIVHRDLKPSNLMVDAEGDLKVADFGISGSLAESVSRVSNRPSTGGTVAYMSPQQALGARSSAGDDIYSLGATLYELLTGRPPFYSGNIYYQLEKAVPPTMAERRKELNVEGCQPIPSHWEETVAACLEKDPANRPQSAREVAWRLGLVMDYEPTPAPQVPKPESNRTRENERPDAPAPEPTPKRGKGPLIAVLALLIACGAAAGWWFGIEQPKIEARQAIETGAKADDAERQRKDAEARAQAAEAEKQRLVAEVKSKAEAEKRRQTVAGETLEEISRLVSEKSFDEAQRRLAAFASAPDLPGIDAQAALLRQLVADALAARQAEQDARARAEATRHREDEMVTAIEAALTAKDWAPADQRIAQLAVQNATHPLLPGFRQRLQAGRDAALPAKLPSHVQGLAVAPHVAQGPDDLPVSGFHSLDGLFAGGLYAGYNDYSKGQILRRVQSQLKAGGFYVGSLDGLPGRDIQAALLAWQRARSLPASGRIDQALLDSMNLGRIDPVDPPERAVTSPPRGTQTRATPTASPPSRRPPRSGRDISDEEFLRKAKDLERRGHF